MRRVARLCAVGLIGMGLAASQAFGQAQEGNRGGRGGRNMQGRTQMAKIFRTIDTLWAGVSFEVSGIDDAKLAELRPAFKEAWEARKKAFQDVQANHDRKGLVQTLNSINEKLEAAVKAALTDAQLKELREYVAKATRMGRSIGQRGRRGGRGQGGGAG